jgi:Protein of unknown function (DUF3300)
MGRRDLEVGTRARVWALGALRVCLAALCLLLADGSAMGQIPTPEMKPPPEEIEAVAASDDTRALVAPVALYPDPLLALIMQAATSPLEVVQAERFLAHSADDPALAPDPDWDPSTLGLLNYPVLIGRMSAYLDWTEAMGEAVLGQLAEVQDAIQAIRWSAYATGLLASNEVQEVIVEEDIIRIEPASPDQISIPDYDPAALLAALEEPPEVSPGEAAPDAAATEAEVESATADGPIAAEPVTTAEPTSAEPTVIESAPVEPMPAEVTTVETVTVPTYTTAQPLVTYGEQESGFWSSAATFAGGAAIGGLLGYAVDDDDNDWDWDDESYGNFDPDDVEDILNDRQDWVEERRGDVTAARDERREDRTDRQVDRRDVQDEQRQDRVTGREERPAISPVREGGPRPAGLAPARATKAPAERAREVALPTAANPRAASTDSTRERTAAKAASPRPHGEARPAQAGFQKPAKPSAAAVQGGRRAVATESARGAQSRAKVDRKSVASTNSPQRAASAGSQRPDRAGGMQVESKDRTQRSAQRGQTSRAKAGGGGREGGGRGGGRGRG